ncbi:MAG: ABC transporter ATP-binding protein [Armatimonadetes bacterium]|nr:ABC transporter ATP-binding protein [Armatimonadota bacterium]
MAEQSKIRTFSRLLKFLRPHWRSVSVGISALVCVTMLELIPPLAWRKIVDDLLVPDSITPASERLQALSLIAVGLLVLHIAIAGFSRTRAFVMHILGEKFILDLRRMIYSHLQKLSLTFFETRQTGEVMSRVTNDSEVVEEFVTHAADTLIADALKVAAIVVILFRLSAPLAMVTMIPVPILGLIVFKYSRKVRKNYRLSRERLGDMNARLQDNLSGIRVIKSFAREEHEYQRFSREAEDYYRMRVEIIRMWTSFFPVTQLVVMLGMVAMWWFGGRLVILHPEKIGLGTVVAFVGYIGMFYQPVANIARINDTIQRALAAADRIFEVLDTEPDLTDALGAVEMPPVKGSVTLEDVHFRYATGEEVLSGINVHCEPGQIVALVGRSGAGKTSIVNLIPRFYDPSQGRILIDGVDIRTVKQQSLRAQIGIVLQDTFLFNGTIRENIAYGRLDATEEEIVTAARAANADSFIRELPQGYDTEVGERGIKLSGGQKQRTAIARAVLADPRILILDEATSSVDSESEYLIHRAMDHLMRGRTTFVIAHRLSTVRHADLIVTLESGRIVEVGDHKSLLEREGIYSQMYDAQYRLDGELM